MSTWNSALWNSSLWNGASGGGSGGVRPVTAGRLIYDACRALGVLRPGQLTSPEGMDDAFGVLNDMVNSWNTESLMIPSMQRAVYPLTTGVSSYTLGPGGTLGGERPQRVRINKLPKWARDYIHEVHTFVGAPEVQELTFLRDQNKQLVKLVAKPASAKEAQRMNWAAIPTDPSPAPLLLSATAYSRANLRRHASGGGHGRSHNPDIHLTYGRLSDKGTGAGKMHAQQGCV